MGTVQTITYRVRRYVPGTGFVAMPGALGFEVQLQSSAGTEGLGFGAAVAPRATIRADAQTLSDPFELVPVVCEAAVNGGAYSTLFRGVLLEQSDDGVGLQYTAGGIDELIRRAEDACPLLYRRPIATATTAFSLDDPDDPDGRAGLLNRIAWRAGGRPLPQAAFYPTAPFFYHFDESSFAPEWSWLDGEDLWAEALAIVQAAGGQLFQDAAGTLRYVQPLSLGTASTSPYTFTNSGYGRATTRKAVRRAVSTVTCRYQRRSLQPTQEVYNDDTRQVIEAGNTLELELALKWPTWKVEAIVVNVVSYQGETLAAPVTVIRRAAQRVEIQIANPRPSEPVLITRVTVTGQPVSVVEESTARYEGAAINGTTVTQRVADSIYIQNQGDARRSCRMLYDFYALPRPVISLATCPFDPARFVGEYVRYTNTRRVISNLPCRITNIRYSRSAAVMDLDLVPVTGIPTRAEIFKDGETYADSTVRKVGY